MKTAKKSYEEPFLAEMKPVPLRDEELAFPAYGLKLLPKWDLIPEEFKRHSNVWAKLVSEMFYGVKGGVAEKYDLEPVDGIDFKLASQHLRAALSSFEPKHEHKMAGVAYLTSLWFKLVVSDEAH